MKCVRGLLLLLVTSGLAWGASSTPAGIAGDEKITRAVKVFYSRWISAYEKRDLTALMLHYDKNVVFNMQGQPDQGLAGIREGFELDFKQRGAGATWRPQLEKIYAQQALVVVVARWEYLEKTAGGKLEVVYTIRSVDLLTPLADGFRIVHTVNYPLT